MPFQFNEQKIVEAASILLECAGGKMNYMLLLKLLYIADRHAFRDWERPITYDRYVSMDRGPVLSGTYDLIMQRNLSSQGIWDQYIKRVSKYEITLKIDPPEIKKLSEAEIALLKKTFKEFGGLDRFTVSQLTHDFPEYKNPHGSSKPISLKELLSALDYNAENIDRITSEIEEEESIAAVFGG